jgi:hypothetical protein
MQPEIWYTARNCFDSSTQTAFGWKKYIEWAKLTHLTELVSLDGILNDLIFEPDYDNPYEWQFVITEEQLIIPYFNNLDYVLEKTKQLKHFNLLAIVQEPNIQKATLANNFQFVGYDLIEIRGDISALSNCGGFEESFLSKDLNHLGLITDYQKARKIQTSLRKHTPNEEHADCYLYEIWRHKTIGRIHCQ